MTVYADTSFFINFAFDAEILILLCKIYSKKVPKLRLFVSALLGGLAGVFVFIPYLEILTRPPARFILPILMVYIVFFPISLKGFLSRYASFLAVSFIMSGAVNFLGINALSGLMIPWVIYFLVFILRKNVNKKKSGVTLEYEGKKICADGFLDSGNMLMSGGMPVILGNDRIFGEIFGLKMSQENIMSLSRKFNIRIIPFKALGENGTVIGIKIDSVLVQGKKYENVVLAYSGNKFSDELILNSTMI